MEAFQSSSLHPIPQSIGSIDRFRVPWKIFVQVVLTLTVDAYQRMCQDGVAHQYWEEDAFSIRLTEDYIQPLAHQHPLLLIAVARTRTHTPEMKRGEVSSKQAPEIDIRLFSSWEKDYHRIYFAWECKRVGDKRVDEKYGSLIPKYITEGVFRFLDGEYASDVDDAGMLGYVLAGEIPNIVNDINQSMLHPRRSRRLSSSDHLVPAPAIQTFTDVYHSRHKRVADQKIISLHHLFLTFDFP
jgi:hypothetical protein